MQEVINFLIMTLLDMRGDLKPEGATIIFTDSHGKYKTLCYYRRGNRIFWVEGKPRLFDDDEAI